MTRAQRKQPEVRRQEIIDALIGLATVRGLESITVRDLAQTAGVTPGLIHHYFPGMDALLAEAFGQWASEGQRRLRDDIARLSPIDQLAYLVLTTSSEEQFWHDALTAAARFEALRSRAIELNAAYQEIVLGIIETGSNLGHFVCADPERTAWRMILMLDGSVSMTHTLGAFEEDEVARIIGPVMEHDLGLPSGSFDAAIIDIETAVRSGALDLGRLPVSDATVHHDAPA
jgi:AcrR family transcriptional regulator